MSCELACDVILMLVASSMGPAIIGEESIQFPDLLNWHSYRLLFYDATTKCKLPVELVHKGLSGSPPAIEF